MRSKIVAGNWKMNNNLSETQDLIKDLKAQSQSSDAKVMIAPTFTNLTSAVAATDGSNIEVIAQNMHYAENGAYTGEVSASMLADLGVSYVIIGHSERRAYNNEDNILLGNKVDTALTQNLQVIYCCGETLEERKSGIHFDLVSKQIIEGVFHLDAETLENIVIAYEPVWAIGTGETATSAQAQEMHAHIRKVITDQYGAEIKQNH